MEENTPEAQTQSTSRHLQRHGRHYVEDGNLVIIVEDTVFRIYGGLLAQRSSVFEAVQNLPQPEGEGETYEGVRAVTLSGDSVQDFSRLLTCVFGPPLDMCDIDSLLSLLDIADKYAFEEVVQWAHAELRTIVPGTVEWLSDHRLRSWTITTAVRIINLSRRITFPAHFAPLAFYFLTTKECVASLSELSAMATLSVEERRCLVRGRQLMVPVLHFILSNLPEFGLKGGTCRTCSSLKADDMLDNVVEELTCYTTDPLMNLIARADGDKSPKKLCNSCDRERRAQEFRYAAMILEELPEFFKIARCTFR